MSKYISEARISYETAARAISLVMEIGNEKGLRPVAAVAAPSMTVLAFGLSDGATPHSAETSKRKAMTSASTRKRSARIAEELSVAMALGTGGMLTRIDGGFPIAFGGVHVGGLGVAGGTPAQDAEVAIEVLERLGADPVEEAA